LDGYRIGNPGGIVVSIALHKHAARGIKSRFHRFTSFRGSGPSPRDELPALGLAFFKSGIGDLRISRFRRERDPTEYEQSGHDPA